MHSSNEGKVVVCLQFRLININKILVGKPQCNIQLESRPIGSLDMMPDGV